MTMTTKWKRAGSAIIAAAAAAVLVGTSALSAVAAAPTWTIKPGGVVTAKTGKAVLEDTTTKTVLTCTSSSAKITLKKGSHLKGAAIGSITTISFSGCTGPLGLTFKVKSSHLPWKLNAVSYNKKTGVTTGTITGIHSSLSGPSCTANVDGTGGSKNNGMVKATYSNKTHKLTVLATGGNLHIYNVSGCLGLINNGDKTAFTAINTVSPKQTITSP